MKQSEGTVSALLVNHLLDLLAQRQAETPIAYPSGQRIPLQVCRKLIHEALERTDEPMLGLKLSQLSLPTGFGIVGYMAQSCASLVDVIQMVEHYERLIGDIFTSSLTYEPGLSLWSLKIEDSDPVTNRYMQQYGMGIRYQLLQLVREDRARIVEGVHFNHPIPSSEAELTLYQQTFQCPVYFDQPVSALVMKSSTLALPLRFVDHGINQHLKQEADRQLKALSSLSSFTDQAREHLAPLIQRGLASREALAEAMGISSRHLHRTLSREGTSYSKLLDELRLSRAEALLGTQATLEEIGKQLGFQDPSSFMRWYRRQTGHSARNKPH